MNKKQTGIFGEQLAQNYLIKNRFKILETNFRYSKFAEIDIIASKKNTLHFIEVKTRTSEAFGMPFEAITKTKLNSIYTCAKYYLANCNKKYDKIQIDAVSIVLDDKQNPKIKFLENISID